MNKPQSLRRALNSAVPYVRDNPDKLHLFVDNGTVVATGAASLSWEYRYTLNVVVVDFSGDQGLLMAPVLEIEGHQRGHQHIEFSERQHVPHIELRFADFQAIHYQLALWIVV